MLTEREEFKRLSATEAEWEKGEFAGWLKTYINKCKGAGGVPAKGTDYTYCKWVALGSVAALGIMSFIDDTVDEYAFGGGYTLYALLTHFSSVALLLFSTPTSPFAQPRNLVGGHLISAVCVCVSP
jgi:CBS-domain-containing membrane protein